MGKLTDIYPWTSSPPNDHFIQNTKYDPAIWSSGYNVASYFIHSGLTPTQALPHSFDTTKFDDIIIEFSTTPISGTTPGVSDRTADCDDSVGNWHRWTGVGTVTSTINPFDISRVRFRFTSKYKALVDNLAFVEIQMNSDPVILNDYCATNPNGIGTQCTIPAFTSVKTVDSLGAVAPYGVGWLEYDPATGWTHSRDPGMSMFQNTAGGAMNATYKGMGLQDLWHIIPATYSIEKMADRAAGNA
jgi:hypothetical protein